MRIDLRWRPAVRGLAALAASAWLSSVAARADGAAPAQGEARFAATGPGGLKIEGRSQDLHVTLGDGAITCTLALASFETGIDLRDEHLRKHLEVGAYPSATLTVQRAALRFPAAGGESAGEAQGQLSLHGQERTVTFSYTAKRSAALEVTAALTVDQREFGLQPPSYLGLTVRPKVEIAVAFKLPDAG